MQIDKLRQIIDLAAERHPIARRLVVVQHHFGSIEGLFNSGGRAAVCGKYIEQVTPISHQALEKLLRLVVILSITADHFFERFRDCIRKMGTPTNIEIRLATAVSHTDNQLQEDL